MSWRILATMRPDKPFNFRLVTVFLTEQFVSRSSQNWEEIIETDLGIEFNAHDKIPKSVFEHIFPVLRESTVKLLIQKTDLSSVNELVELDFILNYDQSCVSLRPKCILPPVYICKNV